MDEMTREEVTDMLKVMFASASLYTLERLTTNMYIPIDVFRDGEIKRILSIYMPEKPVDQSSTQNDI